MSGAAVHACPATYRHLPPGLCGLLHNDGVRVVRGPVGRSAPLGEARSVV
jgi:hypothetical protein